jgi:glycosyltransferase involved in cell wall biosynthesis
MNLVNKQKKYALSVCIPTYNRHRKLIECLQMFAKEIEESRLYEHIDIAISDNCSTDSTIHAINKFIIENPKINIYYKSNDQNLGVDYNCHIALHLGQAKYRWLFCDDDILIKGSLKNIVETCENSNNISFIFVNYNIELNDKIYKSRCKIEKDLTLSGDIFFEATRLASSFASSCIFNENRISLDLHKKYIGTKWYHLYVTRDIIKHSKALILSSPKVIQVSPSLIESRYEKGRTDDNGIEFYISAHLNICDFVNQLNDTERNNGKISFREAYLTIWNENLYQIINYKLTTKNYNTDELTFVISKMIKYFGKEYRLWLIDIPLMLMPKIIFMFIYKNGKELYKKIKI